MIKLGRTQRVSKVFEDCLINFLFFFNQVLCVIKNYLLNILVIPCLKDSGNFSMNSFGIAVQSFAKYFDVTPKQIIAANDFADENNVLNNTNILQSFILLSCCFVYGFLAIIAFVTILNILNSI